MNDYLEIMQVFVGGIGHSVETLQDHGGKIIQVILHPEADGHGTSFVLNLGAGVQSTTIYLMMIDGDIEPADVAIFADTGDEPQAVYDHLTFLSRLDGPEIITVSAGNLGDNLMRGVNGAGRRFVSIPAFLSRNDDGTNTGIGRRQCTKKFKIVPIETEIRRLLGVKPRCRLPKDVTVTEVFGLSFDEPKRVARVHSRFLKRKQWTAEFPLFDEFMTRDECRD